MTDETISMTSHDHAELIDRIVGLMKGGCGPEPFLEQYASLLETMSGLSSDELEALSDSSTDSTGRQFILKLVSGDDQVRTRVLKEMARLVRAQARKGQAGSGSSSETDEIASLRQRVEQQEQTIQSLEGALRGVEHDKALLILAGEKIGLNLRHVLSGQEFCLYGPEYLGRISRRYFRDLNLPDYETAKTDPLLKDFIETRLGCDPNDEFEARKQYETHRSAAEQVLAAQQRSSDPVPADNLT